MNPCCTEPEVKYEPHLRMKSMVVGVAELAGRPELADQCVRTVFAVEEVRPGYWELTARAVGLADTVGPVVSVLANSETAGHYQLHLLMRGWMSKSSLLVDVAPQHCECPTSAQDDIWITCTLIPMLRMKMLDEAGYDPTGKTGHKS